MKNETGRTFHLKNIFYVLNTIIYKRKNGYENKEEKVI